MRARVSKLRRPGTFWDEAADVTTDFDLVRDDEGERDFVTGQTRINKPKKQET